MTTPAETTPPYPEPDWFSKHLDIINGAGYRVNVGENAGSTWAQETDVVVSDFFGRVLDDPDEAIAEIPRYLQQFRDINDRNLSLLNPVLPIQFGLIVNTAALQYSEFSPGRQDALLRVVHDYCSHRRSDKIGTLVSHLRNPDLVQDLVAHWSAIYWPYLNDYQLFLKNAAWENVVASLKQPENNPLMIALSIPYRWTPGELRRKFSETYPDMFQKALVIHASRLRCEGAHEEVLCDSGPFPRTPYVSWENAIMDYLKDYALEFHSDLLQSIAEDPQPRTREWLTFDDLATKLGSTLFTFNEGKLVRVPSA